MADDAHEDDPGGAGGSRPDRGDLASLRLYRRALRNGWEVPDGLKHLAMARVAEVLKEKTSERAVIAAAKAVVSMTAADNAAIDTALKAKAQGELEERLAALEGQFDARTGGKGVRR